MIVLKTRAKWTCLVICIVLEGVPSTQIMAVFNANAPVPVVLRMGAPAKQTNAFWCAVDSGARLIRLVCLVDASRPIVKLPVGQGSPAWMVNA